MRRRAGLDGSRVVTTCMRPLNWRPEQLETRCEFSIVDQSFCLNPAPLNDVHSGSPRLDSAPSEGIDSAADSGKPAMLKMIISPELARVCLVTTFISFGPTTPSGTERVWSWRASPRPTDMRVGWYNKCVSVSLTRMRIGGSKSVTAWVENERSFSRQW